MYVHSVTDNEQFQKKEGSCSSVEEAGPQTQAAILVSLETRTLLVRHLSFQEEMAAQGRICHRMHVNTEKPLFTA